jgi:hypothetical protein
MLTLLGAYLAGFATCAAIVIAILRSTDDHQPTAPIEKEWCN